MTFYTHNRLSTVSFKHEVIGKIIKNLYPNKSHGHGNIRYIVVYMWFDFLQIIRNNFQKDFKYWFVSIRMEKRKHRSYP